jgi:hypothetical protein
VILTTDHTVPVAERGACSADQFATIAPSAEIFLTGEPDQIVKLLEELGRIKSELEGRLEPVRLTDQAKGKASRRRASAQYRPSANECSAAIWMGKERQSG